MEIHSRNRAEVHPNIMRVYDVVILTSSDFDSDFVYDYDRDVYFGCAETWFYVCAREIWICDDDCGLYYHDLDHDLGLVLHDRDLYRRDLVHDLQVR